ncbi:hypothetical protein [Salinigranum halophilum]|uniref:hypothetical protein n=1 Tax=Salinigranum halophilum TaxID=2565931 RepID=UPI001375AE0D|nr:hypothetical protein [Salinigranum halophilum]
MGVNALPRQRLSVLTATALLYFHGHQYAQYRAPDVFANGTQTKFIDLRSRARACSTA